MISSIIWAIIQIFNLIVLFYFLSINSFYFLTSIFAFKSLRKYSRRLQSFDVEELVASAGAPPITLLAPAYNEEATCVEAIKSLLTLNYPEFEIIIINDGSKDSTVETLVKAFEFSVSPRLPMSTIKTAKVRKIYKSSRYSNLWLVDKENGGKSDALNAGINNCRTPFFCVMDADSLLERNALIRIIRPFLEDSSTVAAGGIIRIVNDCKVEHGIVKDIRLPKNLLAKFQVLEYLRAFLSGRMGWDAINATLIISGAFGLFRRTTVIAAGGFATDTVGEDMELVVRLHRYCLENNIDYKIGFVPDPVAWTECPETLKILGNQRDRWQRGLWETLNKHRKMLLNPNYGAIGFVAFPYFYFLEMLGPLIEFLGYISFVVTLIMGRASTSYILAFLALAFVLGVALSIAAVAMEELSFRRYSRFSDLLKLFILAILENFGYRQYITYCRFRGIISVFRKKKSWGRMERKGFKK
ncbi:MAG: glycosyltransferase [Candidatus Electryonea clarkiae]|nr:glycosyltransferase [Candidatus Electryonea clarkiae]